MTKEELKKELYHYIATQCLAVSINSVHRLVYHYDQMEKVGEFIYNLEEKRIAELEKEVEKHKWNNIFLEDCAEYDKKIAEEYTTLQERIAELEKENAELKETIKHFNPCGDWNDDVYDCEFRHYAMEYGSQLTKAKDLLKQWLQANICDSVVLFSDTEQFLKDSEVEK